MLPINSKAKGKGGELEWSRVCRAEGYDVRRTAQFCGNTGMAADCIGLPGIHQEIKRVERLNITDAMEADRLFTELMGEDVEQRKVFIAENASKANLDI